MKSSFLLVLALCAPFGGIISVGFSQSSLPKIAEINAAAENGDAQAQDKLAQSYLSSFNWSTAAKWFRNAAEQGVAHAQWQLGEILLTGRPKFAEDSVAVPKAPDEAIKWLLLAANQGLGEAQYDLGGCYENGQAVKQDYPEAYKWYKLAAQQKSLMAKVYLDRLILKMQREQIQEGERRVGDFVPHQTRRDELPEPQFVQDIVLKGISGPPNRRLVMINNQTIGTGEGAKVKVGQKTVTVKCLEIKEKSAVVLIEGISQPKEIHLR